MRTFACTCGNPLFYANTRCLACERGVAWCPTCRQISPLEPEGSFLRCARPGCDARLAKCVNAATHGVCNRCVAVGSEGRHAGFCDCCILNDTIPDLVVAGNLHKWYLLEQAKRLLMYDLNTLGLPIGGPLPLRFSFMGDTVPADDQWHSFRSQKVYTGHADGLITINISEADSVVRERNRVSFGEGHRTLIGHFRHEVGHYYWQLLVEKRDEAACREVFGDHSPDYMAAMRRYYAEGPPPDWRGRYVSAYATMHAWEDFAETFGLYLDMASTLDTWRHLGLGGPGGEDGTLSAMIAAYQRIGISVNELNRNMGLIEFMPEVITAAVSRKLGYVHDMVRQAADRPSPLQKVANTD